MKNKRMIALVILVIGVALTGLGMYIRHKVNSAKGIINEGSGWLPKNAVGRTAQHMIEEKMGLYEALAAGSLIIGIAGIGTGLYLWVKSRKN